MTDKALLESLGFETKVINGTLHQRRSHRGRWWHWGYAINALYFWLELEDALAARGLAISRQRRGDEICYSVYRDGECLGLAVKDSDFAAVREVYERIMEKKKTHG